MVDDIEPLEPALWFGALKKLALLLDETTGNEELERLLRHAYHLLQLTPRPLRLSIKSDLSESKFERLLEDRAFKAAAKARVGQPMTYAVTRLKSDLFEAKVSLPRQTGSVAVRSDDFATALLAGWARCLIALEARSVTLQTEYYRPIQHEARSGPHPRQIAH